MVWLWLGYDEQTLLPSGDVAIMTGQPELASGPWFSRMWPDGLEATADHVAAVYFLYVDECRSGLTWRPPHEQTRSHITLKIWSLVFSSHR